MSRSRISEFIAPGHRRPCLTKPSKILLNSPPSGANKHSGIITNKGTCLEDSMITNFLHCKMQQKPCPLFNHLQPFLILRVCTVPADIPRLLGQQLGILVSLGSLVPRSHYPRVSNTRPFSVYIRLYPLTSVVFLLFLPHSQVLSQPHTLVTSLLPTAVLNALLCSWPLGSLTSLFQRA